MPGRECYHCKQWLEAGQAHDCWTTTEAALTADLPEDLREAWERLRETAVEFGEQRIYASHHSIMFARRVCYFFVRPKRSYLEVVIFLGRAIKAPQVRRVHESSKARRANVVRITHRDEVEPPITDWLHEAYESVEHRAPTKAGNRRTEEGQPILPKRNRRRGRTEGDSAATKQKKGRTAGNSAATKQKKGRTAGNSAETKQKKGKNGR